MSSRDWRGFRESLKSPINRDDLRLKEGIFYKIEFETGEYYYGISRHSFKRRYQTQTLVGGKSGGVVELAKTKRWDAKIIADGLGWEDLAEIESLVVTKDLIQDPLCLNKNLGGQYSARRYNGESAKPITLVDPHGVEHTFRSGADAAKAVGCSWGEISSVRKGVKSHAKGWHLKGVTPKFTNVNRTITLYRERADGSVEERTWGSVCQAAKDIGAKRTNLTKIINGRRPNGSCNKWKYKNED